MHLKPRQLNSQNDQIYSINNCALPVVDSYKDLGITCDKHLSYTPHVLNITARASQRAKLILTRFTTPATLQETPATMHETRATLQETPATLQ